MTKVIIDAELRTRLNGLSELLELCDESGQILGYFHPTTDTVGAEEVGVRSPFTQDEVERRRQRRAGRPLSEILEKLGDS